MAEKEDKEKKPKVPRQKMPEQEPKVRAKNFDEVPFGWQAGPERQWRTSPGPGDVGQNAAGRPVGIGRGRGSHPPRDRWLDRACGGPIWPGKS